MLPPCLIPSKGPSLHGGCCCRAGCLLALVLGHHCNDCISNLRRQQQCLVGAQTDACSPSSACCQSLFILPHPTPEGLPSAPSSPLSASLPHLLFPSLLTCHAPFPARFPALPALPGWQLTNITQQALSRQQPPLPKCSSPLPLLSYSAPALRAPGGW